MDTSREKKYVCFSCLKESIDPQICSHCGSSIENFDFSSSRFIPPVKGIVKIKKAEGVERMVRDVVMDLYEKYHDDFIVDVSSQVISVECNDVAGQRLVKYINKRFREEEVGCEVRFTPFSGSACP